MITAESQIPIKQVSEKSTEKRKHRKFLNAYARQWMTGWLTLTDVVCAFIALLLALQLHWFSNVEFSLAYVEIFALFCLILLIKFIVPVYIPALDCTISTNSTSWWMASAPLS